MQTVICRLELTEDAVCSLVFDKELRLETAVEISLKPTIYFFF